MRPLFYGGLAALAAFEVASVYFIMPFPGSQGLPMGLGVAYFLHAHRWAFRIACGIAIALGAAGRAAAPGALAGRSKWLALPAALVVAAIAWLFNFQMTADHMFLQPAQLSFAGPADNRVDPEALVIGAERDGEAKAYPIRFIAYHHQVRDTLGGRPVMVTYCSVCRSGRVFEPLVDGHAGTFRLVGMDNFNAMFEDAGTGTWWRQATGRAVAGPLAGHGLDALDAQQMTVAQWFALHPAGVVMQADPAALDQYDPAGRYERGESTGTLTRTDRGSWNDKSWVVGLQLGDVAKAYDWNRLAREHVINDDVGGKRIALVLAADGRSFAAFERPTAEPVTWQDGRIAAGAALYDLSGRDVAAPQRKLPRIAAYQEFWHSWRTFHPQTGRDGP